MHLLGVFVRCAGVIPTEIGQLKALRELRISNLHLTGERVANNRSLTIRECY